MINGLSRYNQTIKFREECAKYRGVKESEIYDDFTLHGYEEIQKGVQGILATVPPSFGACAPLSASLAAYLRDHYDIPAVAGDLKIESTRVFKCKKNIPTPGKSGKVINKSWDGHCWVEIDDFICDVSVFRTAYTIDNLSVLKSFILSNFGQGRGAILSPIEDLPSGMKYIPKYVLTDNQIDALIAGVGQMLDGKI